MQSSTFGVFCLLCLLYSCDLIAQINFKAGTGIQLTKIKNVQIEHNRDDWEFKATNNFTLPTPLLLVSFNKYVGRRFEAAFQCNTSIKEIPINGDTVRVLTYYGNGLPDLPVKTWTFNQQFQLRFEYFRNLFIGVGGYFQFQLCNSHRNKNFWRRTFAPHAGALVTAGFRWERFHFELAYQKNVGGLLYKQLRADYIDQLQLSASYQLHTFKTKKERRERRASRKG